MLIVGGTFDKKGGKRSYIVGLLARYLRCDAINGGTLEDLYSFRPQGEDILIWMPKLDNEEDKILPRLKVMNPKMILVSSKVVVMTKNIPSGSNYSMFELVTRAIDSKSNLCIIINHSKLSIHKQRTFEFSLIDPLGNIFCKRQDITSFTFTLQARLLQLSQTKRIPSIQLNTSNSPYQEPDHQVSIDFINLVRTYAERFEMYIMANNPNRFLGNASTRCQSGFPSMRVTPKSILVSKRNINKTNITKDDFVEVSLFSETQVLYKGNNKPSVDTPIQIALYNHFPKINYIIHGHCYIKDAPFTQSKVPCGDLREIQEILNITDSKDTCFETINLLGHGCLIMSDSIIQMNSVELESRPLPEGCNNEPWTKHTN